MSATTATTTARAGGLFGRLANLKIKTRVLLGFICVLVLLAAVSITAFVSFTKVAGQFTSYEQRVNVVEMASEIELQIADLRRYVREFAVTGEDEQADKAHEHAKEIDAVLARAQEEIKNPERLAKVGEVAKDFASYRQGFDQIIALKHEEDQLVKDKMNPLGKTLTEEFEGLIAEAAKAGNSNAAILAQAGLQSLMQVRLNANKMIATGDETIGAEVETHFASLTEALKGLDPATKGTALRASYDQIEANDNIYYEAYERVAKIAKELEHLIDGAMREAALAMDEAAVEVQKSAAQDQDALKTETDASIETTSGLIILLSVGALVMGLVFAWLIGRGIANPVIAMTGAMHKLASGDKTVEIPGRGRGDEIGQMATAVQVFKDTAIEAERLANEEQKAQAERERRAQRMAELTADFDRKISGVVEIVSSSATEMQATASAMASTAEETSRQASSVAAASEEATTNVQSVASAADELSASIGEISRQVSQSSTVAQKAVTEANRTNDTVKSLAEAAQKIGEVVNLINDIASRTNLLALNATIEAARAGEAGKGFAVVASEVKSLANQTAKATDEISAQIAGMQQVTSEAVDAIGSISTIIGEINQIAGAIASAVEEQGAATQEIARNVQQAAAGTTEVSSNIGGVTQAATDTGAAANQVLAAAGELSKQSEALRAEVDSFLSGVKAA